jgi:predicted RNA-binding protein with PIN domain
LEAALTVARAGEEAVPAQSAPVSLRPFLQFTRLPGRALVVARKALDGDEGFRVRVVQEVSEAGVGRAGWLFLTRPPGWEADLEALVQEAEKDRAEAAERRSEGEARRRLAGAEETARRAEEAAEAARAEAAKAADALAEQRRSRREVDRRASALAARLEEVTADLRQARADAAAATAGAAEARRRAEAATGELEALREVAPARAGPAAPAEPLPAPSRPPEGAGEGGGDTRLAGPLAAAAAAARSLADALASAAASLDGAQASAPTAGAASPGRPDTEPRPGPSRPSRRLAAALPPGILEDSPEAAEHLSRLRGVVVLVDGYNVSQAAWPGTPIAEQRRRLVDALGELAARTGAEVRVVFDGADTVGPPVVAATPQAVRVRFSAPGVEADDVIVTEVGEIPRGRPVVVASSDRRVRDESRARGANLLRSSQLLGLLHLR